MPSDPFAELGLAPDASIGEVRDARRRLALQHHPDLGGDAARMREVNEAADAASRAIARRTPRRDASEPSAPRPEADNDETATRDVPSFTVEALPAETFEALLLVAAAIGEVLDDDPPYRLDTYLAAPLDCWCRLDLVADAGSSTVNLTIASLEDHPIPSIVAVRDAWIANLNTLDWPD